MANRIVLNETSYHGAGAINEIVNEVKIQAMQKNIATVGAFNPFFM